MKKHLLFFLIVVGFNVSAQQITVRPYAYNSLAVLNNHTILVGGSTNNESYLEVFDMYGNLKAVYKDDLNFLIHTRDISVLGDKIYRIYSDGHIGYLMQLDFQLNVLNKSLLDTTYAFYSTSSQHLLYNHHIYMVQPKKKTERYYFNKYDLNGKLLTSQLLDTTNCYYFAYEPAIQAINDHTFLLANSCDSSYSVYIDTSGKCTASTLPTTYWACKFRYLDNYIYATKQFYPYTGMYCFLKYDRDETLIKEFCVPLPDRFTDLAGWLDDEFTFVPMGNDRFYFLSEMYDHRASSLLNANRAIGIYIVDYKNESAQLIDLKNLNYAHPALLKLDNGKNIILYTRKEGDQNLTHIEFFKHAETCSATSFPNPSTSYFTVESECLIGQASARIEFTDNMGREVAEQEFPVNEDGKCVVRATLSQGIYHCKITSGSIALHIKQAIFGE